MTCSSLQDSTFLQKLSVEKSKFISTKNPLKIDSLASISPQQLVLTNNPKRAKNKKTKHGVSISNCGTNKAKMPVQVENRGSSWPQASLFVLLTALWAAVRIIFELDQRKCLHKN